MNHQGDSMFFVAAFFRRLMVGVGLFLSIQAHALELSCIHLDPIQKKFLSRHVNYSQLDANLEKRTVDQFIKSLDPSKIYFLESDVHQIRTALKNVYQKTKNGDCASINVGYDILMKRMREMNEIARTYLGPDFKVDKKTKMVLNADKRSYAKTEAKLKEFQKKYMQLQVANSVATGGKQEEAIDRIKKNYERSLKRMADESLEDRLALYLDSFARSLDPHSTYWAQDTYNDFRININLSLEGIGATLSSKDGFTVIEQLLPGGAAEKSGQLQPKDKITAVAQGDDGPFVNVMDQDLRDVVKQIRGKKGTKVRLSVLRKKGDQTQKFQVALTRDQIDLDDEAAQVHYMDRKISDTKTQKVALIDLPSFYADARPGGRSSAADVRKLLREARQKNVDAVVLDLSRNGGGSLDDAVGISGLFFREGNVVKQSSRNPLQGEMILADEDPVVHFSGPLIVLTSRVSASASEIVAGTLKDYSRAVIVGGDHTYGKGTVQAVEELPQGLGALKTTIGMFFTAGGKSTQHVGVNSDIVLPSPWSTDEIGEKTQDYSLPPRVLKPFLSAEAVVVDGPSAWRPVGKREVDQLRTQSVSRVNASTDFKKIRDEIAKSKKRKEEVSIGELIDNKDKDEADAEERDKDVESGKTYAELKKDRLAKYLKRADISEAVNIAGDLAILQSGGDIRLVRKETKPVDEVVGSQVNEATKKN
jgi:carboxyl-terminal processing protease